MSDRFETQEDVFRFLDIIESKGVGNLIPFPDDLLFNFFNKKTVISDTYLQDSISTLKLYPRKSNNLVTTSVNTQFHVAKELVDYILGFEISVDVYYDPAALSMSNYNACCGRGNNSAFPSSMSLPGASATSIFFGKWKDGTLSQISKTGLTADWYRYSMVVTATTCQIKLLNLRTNVELSGNVATVGTSTVSEDKNFTFLCYGIDGITGAYGSVGVNYSNIKILRGSTCLLNVPLSEGADTKVTDICNSSQYQLSFFTAASGWAKLSNYFHWNFRYGFTLYQKSGSPDLRIPNKKDGTEIVPSSVPTGYSRIANYKECRQTFNNCENVFVLDDVSAGVEQINATFNQGFWGGTFSSSSVFAADGEINSKTRYVNSDGDVIKWMGAYWGLYSHVSPAWRSLYSYLENIEDVLTAWTGVNQSFELQTGEASDLYNADPDHVLFTEDTGVAKQIEISSMYSEIVDLTHDRGHLYINEDSDANFMLYKTDKGVDTPADLKIWKYVEK